MPRLALLISIAAFGCGADVTSTTTPPDAPDGTSPTVAYLTPVQHLSRASLALRGVRPSLDDLKAVAVDPTALPAIVDRYLASPEFGDTIEDLHNASLLLRVEFPLLVPPAGPIAGATFTDMAHIFHEPLKLIRDIVTTDQPYTAIVTADYTMANATVATVWGLAHTQAPDVWEHTTWPDGRDAAGILTSSVVFERWKSTGFNYNRGRANMVSRALLCHDFLDSDIAVDTSVDLSDPEAVAHAVVANPSCAACHQTLDPLASYFFPHTAKSISRYPVTTFDATKVDLWKNTNERPPLFFGTEATHLGGLGQAIAADPRFARCAAIHFASYLTEVGEDDLPGAWIAKLQAGFEASGFNAKQLAKAIVLADEFRVSHDTDASRADATVGYLKLRPEQQSRMLADLTGLEWTTDSTTKVGFDVVGHTNLFESDYVGFRALAGGVDSYFVTQPVLTMNATASLSAKRAASAAAEYVVETNPAALFEAAPPTTTDEAGVRAELVYLHARIFGELVAASDASVDQSWALFSQALAASADAKRAWKLTLIGMLTDVRAQFY